MSEPVVTIDEQDGEAAVTLAAGRISATFLPSLGMLGTSLCRDGEEFLSLPEGSAAFAQGHTTGLPLLAPWANRLAGRHYRAGRVAVDLEGMELHTDERGRPIHGTMLGRHRWAVARVATSATTAGLRAGFDYDDEALLAAFPFPHRITLEAALDAESLTITTTIEPTGRRRIPVTFGFHPYFRLPTGVRDDWRVALPRCRHLELDDGIPTGFSITRPRDELPLAGRAPDDLFALGADRRLALVGPSGMRLDLRFGRGYPFAQVFSPEGSPHCAIEPMTAPTNALVTGDHPWVVPGDRFRARFSITPSETPSGQPK